MTVKFALILFTTVIVGINAQQLKDVVKGHINDAVRNTKVQLGLGIPVNGKTGYETSDTGTNLTFILSGRDLGTSDAFVKLSYTSRDSYGDSSFGNTESGTETSSPDWTQPFWFIWNKGTGQKWNFQVLDHNSEDKLIGEGVTDVDSFVALGDNATLTISLDRSNFTAEQTGQLIIQRTKTLKFKLAASNIQRSDEFNGRSDPYVKVYFRNGENGKDTKFYTTSTIDNTENARWDDLIEFPNYRVGTDQYLRFKLRDADSVTKDDHLGEVIVRADSINSEKQEQTIYLENSGEHSSLTIIPVFQ